MFALAGIADSVNGVMLQDNSIESLPSGLFEPLTNATIQTLRLDGNRLRTLPEGLLTPVEASLGLLALSRNQLEYLDVQIFTPLTDLRELYVSDNPNLGCIPEVPTKFPPIEVYKDSDTILCPKCTEAGQTLYFGEQACGPCIPGTYSPATAEAKYGDCRSCPPHSSSLSASASVFDCKCSPGYTGPDGGSCLLCESASYKSVNGSIPCTRCPAHTSSPAGSNNVSQCVCTPGYTGPDGRECLACPLGTFKQANGSSPCLLCEPGKYSTTPSASDESACALCPANSFSRLAGSQHITNCTCNRGFSGPDGGECVPCSPGRFKTVNGTSPCLPCPNGTYSFSVAATSNSTCNACPPHSFSGQGASTQASCECDAGYAGANGGPCLPCAPGLFKKSSGSAWCMPCPAGTFADSVSSCRDCPSPLTSLEASPDISYCLCPAGLRGPGLLGEGLELLPPFRGPEAALLEQVGLFARLEAEEELPESTHHAAPHVFLDSAGYYGQLASLAEMTTSTMVCSDAPVPDFCLDVDGWTDVEGDGCEWYDFNPDDCYSAEEWAVDGVDASMVCCVCGAGTILYGARQDEAPSCEVTFSNLDPLKGLWITIDLVNSDFANTSEYISSVRASVPGERLCEGHGYSKAECLSLGRQFGQPCCQWNESTIAADHGWPPTEGGSGVGACLSQVGNSMCDTNFLGSGFLATDGEDQNCGKMSRIVDSMYLARGAAAGEITITLNASAAVGSVARSEWCLNSTLFAHVSVSQPSIEDSMTVLVYQPPTRGRGLGIEHAVLAPTLQPVNAHILKIRRNFSSVTCTAEAGSSPSESGPSCSTTSSSATTPPAPSLASRYAEVIRLLEACARDRASSSNHTSAFCPDVPVAFPLCAACLPVWLLGCGAASEEC